MFIVWEGSIMCKTGVIVRYELKMQFGRPAVWVVFGAAVLLCQLDSFPSAVNLARLEFLPQPAYFISRIMSFDVLVLLFGLMFLLAGRLSVDERTGVESLFMAAPLKKSQYAAGKLVGGFLFTFLMLCAFLWFNMAVYFAAAPFSLSVSACVFPLVKACLVCGLPASLFVGFVSVALPGVMDVRLFYMLGAVLFGVNAANVGSAEAMPFYLITSGDLVRLIWRHPRWPFVNWNSVLANVFFLTGTAAAAAVLLLIKRDLWRKGS